MSALKMCVNSKVDHNPQVMYPYNNPFGWIVIIGSDIKR
jgi:hypothetical protein